MKNSRHTDRDDREDDDELFDHGGDLDWSDLGSLLHMDEAGTNGLNFTMLGYYARDARRPRRKSHRRY